MQEQQYVGIDLHRRRSVIVRMNDAGEVLGTVRITNDPLQLAMAIAEAGPDPEVALEACYGWYWAADLLAAEGARVHLVHPLGLHWDTRRVKNDVKDATELANRLRRSDLPEAWISPPEVRELRELVRYRARLVALRTSAKAQVHAVMAKLGILPTQVDMFSPTGQVVLDEMPFEGVYGLASSRCAIYWRSSTGKYLWSSGRSTDSCKTIAAIEPSRCSTGSGRSPPRSSWLRSEMSPGSPPLGICARGLG